MVLPEAFITSSDFDITDGDRFTLVKESYRMLSLQVQQMEHSQNDNQT